MPYIHVFAPLTMGVARVEENQGQPETISYSFSRNFQVEFPRFRSNLSGGEEGRESRQQKDRLISSIQRQRERERTEMNEIGKGLAVVDPITKAKEKRNIDVNPIQKKKIPSCYSAAPPPSLRSL